MQIRYLRSKTEEKKTTIECYIFESRVGSKFQLRLTILIFCSTLLFDFYEFWVLTILISQTGHFWSQIGKMNTIIEYWILLHIWISLGMNFQLKLTILIFWTKFASEIFSGWKQTFWTPLNSTYSKWSRHRVSAWTNNSAIRKLQKQKWTPPLNHSHLN